MVRDEAAVRERVAALVTSAVLPDGWKLPEVFVEWLELGGVPVGLVGLVATHTDTGAEVTGSAAEREFFPVERACYELIERLWTTHAMRHPLRRYAVGQEGEPHAEVRAEALFPEAEGGLCLSRSNGVAAHPDRAMACRNARLELVERDRVLRSWFGFVAPVHSMTPPDLCGWLSDSIEWHVGELPPVPGHDLGPSADGVGVAFCVALPRRERVPLACGFAARGSREAAQAAAIRECVQVLGFLWGEDLPQSSPSPEPAPRFHQAFYLATDNHARVRAWLEGRHCELRVRHEGAVARAKYRPSSIPNGLVDLAPELGSRCAVVHVIDERYWPLVFGAKHPRVNDAVASCIGPHPIS